VRSKWSYQAIGLGFPLFWIASWICARYAHSFFIEVAREDSWIENTQVVVLVVGAIMSAYLARKLYGEGLKLWTFLYALFALVLFFVAGEEISWGQRIFGISPPRWFMPRNYQQELNLHNLRSGRPLVSFIRIGCPILLIALSAGYAALGKKRIEKWRAYLYLPHPHLDSAMALLLILQCDPTPLPGNASGAAESARRYRETFRAGRIDNV